MPKKVKNETELTWEFQAKFTLRNSVGEIDALSEHSNARLGEKA
jgi:hypothetical protein